MFHIPAFNKIKAVRQSLRSLLYNLGGGCRPLSYLTDESENHMTMRPNYMAPIVTSVFSVLAHSIPYSQQAKTVHIEILRTESLGEETSKKTVFMGTCLLPQIFDGSSVSESQMMSPTLEYD
jgi:hypothetical protein